MVYFLYPLNAVISVVSVCSIFALLHIGVQMWEKMIKTVLGVDRFCGCMLYFSYELLLHNYQVPFTSWVHSLTDGHELFTCSEIQSFFLFSSTIFLSIIKRDFFSWKKGINGQESKKNGNNIKLFLL